MNIFNLNKIFKHQIQDIYWEEINSRLARDRTEEEEYISHTRGALDRLWTHSDL